MWTNEGPVTDAANLILFLSFGAVSVQLCWALRTIDRKQHFNRFLVVFLIAGDMCFCAGTHLFRLFPDQDALIAVCAWITCFFSTATAVALFKVAFLVLQLPEENERLEQTITSVVAMREKAEEAYKTLGSFVGFLCHELRNPLHSVVGLTTMLKVELKAEKEASSSSRSPSSAGAGDSGQGGASEIDDLFLGIETSCTVMKAVLDDSLDFCKLDAGRMTLEAVPFELARVVATVSRSFSGRAAQNRTGLQVKVADGLARAGNDVVLGDPIRLAQVLTNLISNAIKFTAGGQVAVHARQCAAPAATASGKVPANRLWVEITVKDNGIGIAPDALPLLFKPFSQAHVSTSRRYGGTGLGLSIVRRIVDIMDGDVGLESVEGRGTTARVVIPFVRKADVDAGLVRVEQPDSQQVAKLGSSSVSRLAAAAHRPGGVRGATGGNAESDAASGSGDHIITVHSTAGAPSSRASSLIIPAARRPAPRVQLAPMAPRTGGVSSPESTPLLFARRGGSSSPVCDSPTIPSSPGLVPLRLGGGRHVAPREEKSNAAGDNADERAGDACSSGDEGGNGSVQGGGGGGGSGEFSVSIPSSADPAERDRAHGEGEERPQLTMLVIDDDPLVLKVNQYILKRAGCAVVSASSGEEAVGILRRGETQFDAVMCDLMMPPGMGGLETIRAFRRMGFRGPCIACTGGSGSVTADRESTRKAGFNDLVFKPVDRALIGDKIAAICESTGTRTLQGGKASRR